MKALTIVAAGSLSTLSAGVSIAQSGHMMDGSGWMGGYGGVRKGVLKDRLWPTGRRQRRS